MGLDHTADYGIIGPPTEFYTDTPRIVCVWQTEGAPVTLPIKSVWIAEDVGSAAPPNYELAEKSLTGADIGDFSITSPSNGWPVGQVSLGYLYRRQAGETAPVQYQAEIAEEEMHRFTTVLALFGLLAGIGVAQMPAEQPCKYAFALRIKGLKL